MAGTTSIRVAAKRRIIDLLGPIVGADGKNHTADGVTVDYTFPGGDLKDEHIWFLGTTGLVDVRDYRAGRAARDDSFTLTVGFYAGKPGQSPIQADLRLEELYGLVGDLLADNPKLCTDVNDPSTALAGVMWAAQKDALAEFDAPQPNGEEGFVAEGRAAITIRTILT